MTPRTATLAAVAAATLAVAAPALGVGSFTVKEGSTPGVTTGDQYTWFTGMYSPQGNPRGHIMGVEGRGMPSTLSMVFGSGARLVSHAPHTATGSVPGGFVRRILGGTGSFLGATGVERTTVVKGVYTHHVRYSLPPAGTKRTYMAYVVKLGRPVIVVRGGAGGVGNGRVIDGTIFDAAGTKVGTYRVDSTLVYTYGAGSYEWYSGGFSYTFADGALLAAGPYQRASASAPGALGASGRVVTGGTGAYAGMRGQVVVTPNADGSSTHSFTLIRR